eukprot:2171460-Prymnesium_polylepis.1
MEFWALEVKAVQTHSSRRQRMVVERLESEHSPAVTATGPCWMQRSLAWSTTWTGSSEPASRCSLHRALCSRRRESVPGRKLLEFARCWRL